MQDKMANWLGDQGNSQQISTLINKVHSHALCLTADLIVLATVPECDVQNTHVSLTATSISKRLYFYCCASLTTIHLLKQATHSVTLHA